MLLARDVYLFVGQLSYFSTRIFKINNNIEFHSAPFQKISFIYISFLQIVVDTTF